MAAAEEESRPRILLVYSADRLLPATVDFDNGFRRRMEELGLGDAVYYTEFLDLARLEETASRRKARVFRTIYEGNIDLIVSMGPVILQLLTLDEPARAFAGVPIVLTTVETPEVDSVNVNALDNPIVHVPVRWGFAGTLRMIPQIQPEVERIYVVAGQSRLDRVLEQRLRKVIEQEAFEPEMIFLSGLTISDLLEQVRNLPEDSAILFLSVLHDGLQPRVSRQVAVAVAQSANVPVYGGMETYLHTGIVGGELTAFLQNGRDAADQAYQILRGGGAAYGTSLEPTVNRVAFDARALEKWGIDEDRLPPGAEIVNRRRGFWERHQSVLLTSGALILVQTLLIALLGYQIGKRRRAESQARMTRDELRLMTDMLPAVFFHVEAGTLRVLYMSQTARRWWDMACYPEEEKSLSQCLPPEVYAGILPLFSPQPDVSRHAAFPFTKYAQETAYAEAQVVPQPHVMPGSGQPSGYVGLILDVTDRHDAEMQARRLSGELAHSQRVSVLGELTAAIAHELNQPLAAILLNAVTAGKLLDKEDAALDEATMGELREIVQDVVADDKRAANIIRRLRKFLSRNPVQMTRVDLSQVVTEALRLMQGDLALNGITVNTDLSPNLPEVHGDVIQLEQVIVNLLRNAEDAINGSENKDAKLITVRTGAADGGKTVFCAVEDAGSGIDVVDPKKLFEAFYTTKAHGMGLGLSLGQRIMEAHGGEISAENLDHAGARFTITLPSISQAQSQSHP